MTRLPPGWPAPWMETDGGGAAELQTDVMRFMAILALCLVAIFALVQAVPPEMPATPEPVAVSPAKELAAVSMEPANVAEPEKTLLHPLANLTPAKAEVQTPASRPSRVLTHSESQVPAAPLPAARSGDAGLTLRFASDDALKSLVARRDVGLYAMHGEQAKRLHVGRGRLEFWTASMPAAFHEMDAATVPGDVITALSRVDGERTAVRWGVTLPSQLSQEIDRHLATGGNGDLVISATGSVRLE
jgi:hypothetical protein